MPHKLINACDTMEKVWEELKKIEAQAQQIQTEAQDRAKKMTQQAKQDAEKLVANSKIYADEESQKLYAKAIDEANVDRDSELKANQVAADKLKVQAEKRMDKAVLTVVDSVIEEN
jgi:vacuolar-type H+-ATPase subunit H